MSTAHKTSSTAGTVMKISATLNVENHGMQIMSMTSPVAMRSIRLPIAPPVMAASSHSSGFLRTYFFATAHTTNAMYTAATTTKNQRFPLKSDSAMPSFVI